jgi:hypothetical protein
MGYKKIRRCVRSISARSTRKLLIPRVAAHQRLAGRDRAGDGRKISEGVPSDGRCITSVKRVDRTADDTKSLWWLLASYVILILSDG